MSRGETLKSAVASLSAGYQLPAAGPSPATALISQTEKTTMNMHVAVPGKPQDSRARNLATQERERQKTLQRLAGLRREASDEITRLIAFLDATDTYVQNECEEECEDEGAHCADDREADDLEHGGEAETENDEPSLGWTDEEATRGRPYAGTMGRSFDLEINAGDMPEDDPAEAGIADYEGLYEQLGTRDWQQGAMA